MSDSEELPDDFTTRIIVQLSVYSSAKDSKGKVKELKTTKIKELDYTLTLENYVEFLVTVLSKHTQDKYKVTERRPYAFKYLYPPLKAYVLTFYSFVCCH